MYLLKFHQGLREYHALFSWQNPDVALPGNHDDVEAALENRGGGGGVLAFHAGASDDDHSCQPLLPLDPWIRTSTCSDCHHLDGGGGPRQCHPFGQPNPAPLFLLNCHIDHSSHLCVLGSLGPHPVALPGCHPHHVSEATYHRRLSMAHVASVAAHGSSGRLPVHRQDAEPDDHPL